MADSEIIFAVEESPEGGYEARALGYPIFTQADSLAEMKAMVQDAVRCHFDLRIVLRARHRIQIRIGLPGSAAITRSPEDDCGIATPMTGRSVVAGGELIDVGSTRVGRDGRLPIDVPTPEPLGVPAGGGRRGDWLQRDLHLRRVPGSSPLHFLFLAATIPARSTLVLPDRPAAGGDEERSGDCQQDQPHACRSHGHYSMPLPACRLPSPL